MPRLLGTSLIGSRRAEPVGSTFFAHDPAGATLEPPFHRASMAEVDEACRLARAAFDAQAFEPSARASVLRSIADGLGARSSEIVARAEAETALPRARLESELVRTRGQLALFAEVAAEGSWVDARIDTADPQRRPAPRPDIRSMRVALGPVAVFGAGNFPLAFSVAGGDTAAALAAGNPVVVKAHPGHPGTSELVATVIREAIRHYELHEGTFSLLFDEGFDVGRALVQHPMIRAVAFTGSREGGAALAGLCAARPEPIPVFAEMGSVNPVVVMPLAARERASSIAAGLHASFTLGAGQFCTNPGLLLLPEGEDGDTLVQCLIELVRATPSSTMLSAATSAAYRRGLDRLRRCGATLLGAGAVGAGPAPAQATVWDAAFRHGSIDPELVTEVFGPATVLFRYPDVDRLIGFMRALEGQLSISIHATDEDIELASPLIDVARSKAGRVVFNQFPTGVEVVPAMVHGGPFPASSDPRTTSVGTRAIERFARLVAFQNAPSSALPPELRDENPRGILRMIDGRRSLDAIRSSG